MKRTRALLSCLLVVASGLATPQTAAAAVCQYERRDLPVPAESGSVVTLGGSADDSRVVGLVDKQGYGRGALWVNGALSELPPPASPVDHIIPQSVNNSGVVVGFEQRDNGLDGVEYRAFRYENGAYTFLPGPRSKAISVNAAGDVLVAMWERGDSSDSASVVLWQADGTTTRSLGRGKAIGVNDQRKVVIQGIWETSLIDATTGTTRTIPGQPAHVRLDGDRVFLGEVGPDWKSTITEWTLRGVKVATYPGGTVPFGRNSHGIFFGTYRPNSSSTEMPSVWSGAERTEVAADQLPFSTAYGDVMDDGTLIGTYGGADSNGRPALWVCG
ncbi:hypothetical protein [Lentzea sp. NPDC055074]